MIPFLTLGAFAGVRHAEIQRLEWKDIRFDDGSIEIRASKAKTASRRLVPILPNLKEWLLKYRQADERGGVAEGGGGVSATRDGRWHITLGRSAVRRGKEVIGGERSDRARLGRARSRGARSVVLRASRMPSSKPV
jgi:integrase